MHISRRDAIERGSVHYFTGRPCLRGHVDKRLSSNGACVKCSNDRVNRRYHQIKCDPVFQAKIRRKQSAYKVKTVERLSAKRASLQDLHPNVTIIFRKEARAAGAIKYFTGKRCPRGHMAKRTVSDGACVECAALKAAKRYADHRDIVRVQKKIWGKKNKARLAAQVRAWGNANPDRRAQSRRNRRAREMKAEGRHTAADILSLLAQQLGMCACGCGVHFSEVGYDVDHKVPLSRGGSNWPENLQLLTPSCNYEKADKTMDEWLEWKLKQFALCQSLGMEASFG